MPSDQMHTRVMTHSGKTVGYVLTRVTHDGQDHEVWGYAPLCYRQVKQKFVALMSRP